MFEWLDYTLQEAAAHPDTAFVVRAHPYESRRGKPSNEPVGEWLKLKRFLTLPNLIFVTPSWDINSYELISISKFSLKIYNLVVKRYIITMI